MTMLFRVRQKLEKERQRWGNQLQMPVRIVRTVTLFLNSHRNFGARNRTKDMTILTLPAIEADPRNAVEFEWPADADRVFMKTAYRAAKRCAVIEYDLLIAARDLVAWRLCEACLDVKAASIMLFE